MENLERKIGFIERIKRVYDNFFRYIIFGKPVIVNKRCKGIMSYIYGEETGTILTPPGLYKKC